MRHNQPCVDYVKHKDLLRACGRTLVYLSLYWSGQMILISKVTLTKYERLCGWDKTPQLGRISPKGKKVRFPIYMHLLISV